MAEQISITEEGLKNLQNELEYLKTTKRNEVRESVKVARSFGDLSENSEYDAARNEQAQVEAKISELEDKLKRVKVFSDSEITTDRVNVGTKVKVFSEPDNKETEYVLVGSTEVNPFEHKISDTSPIGKAIIGSKVGDTVFLKLAGGEKKLIIKEISKQ